MNLAEFQTFTRALTANVSRDQRVLGLVAMGSMAQQDTQPDAWSDHDFFLIVTAGAQEAFKDDLSWLPQTDDIVLAFRETAHGMKALYGHGHLLEFAVFDLEELAQAKVNRYAVLLDRADVAAQMARAAEETAAAATTHAPSDHSLLGQFLANLFVGVGRRARGEQISGRQFVHSYALGHLLRLLTRHLPRPFLDNLDPYRRFERVYPQLGRQLNDILRRDAPYAALGLLDFAAEHMAGRIPDFPAAAVAVVREYAQRAAGGANGRSL